MKKEELEKALLEIHAVCNKHGVVLVGTCMNESIYGEILISKANPADIQWIEVEEQLTNTLFEAEGNFYVLGIGGL